MAEFDARYDHRRTGKTLGSINGKAYGDSNIYVFRSSENNNPYQFESPARTNTDQASPPKPAANHTPPPPPPYESSLAKTRPWIDSRQMKRRKRIAKYKLYAYEGKVKNSFKKGIRWIKHKCRNIVHGF